MTAGLVTRTSTLPAAEVADRLVHAAEARGMTVFARIDHARGAIEAGLAMRPTVVVLFGSPHSGTPLMQAAQTIGLDLPLRALVWEDAGGVTRITYEDPGAIATRHGIATAAVGALDPLRDALAAVTREAVGDGPR